MDDEETQEIDPRSFDTIEVAPASINYGGGSAADARKGSRLGLPAFTAEAAGGGGGDDSGNIDKNSLLLNDGAKQKNTIDEDAEMDAEDQRLAKQDDPHHGGGTKFGMFDGVLGRCLLCMWGVIMFLRTGFIVGQAGIFQSTFVILASGSITFSTTLSLSAICTNGTIQHGGPYFLISRSLGPAFGAVIGTLFAFANCIGVALHLVGFSEAIVSLYSDYIFGGERSDIVLWAELGLFFLLCLAWGGVGWIIRFNLMLLALMMISITVFIIGTFTTSPDKKKLGFTGYSSSTFSENWGPGYTGRWDFLQMIGIFFPSVTGCMAGANISGDLKNPAYAIPVGTVTAVLFSLFVYIVIAWMLGATCLRESTDGKGGLLNDNVIMSNVAFWRPLVDMGIFASTFSSATSCFVAAPRIFKALCDDGLFPFFNVFAVGRKRDGEPTRVFLIVTAVCFVIMLSGEINFIAPIVTNFFLITYSLINYSVFVWDTSKLAGWRPTFQYYNGYVALFTSIACIALMFLIHWGTALGTVLCGAIVYKYIDNKDFSGLDWGTLTESAMYDKACKIILKYQTIKQHAKNVRPTFLIFNYGSIKSERTADTMDLFRLCQALNYSESLIVLGDVILGSLDDQKVAQEYMMKKLDFSKYNKDKQLTDEMIKKCVVEICVAPTFQQGCRNMLQLSGMGSMKPNVVIIKMGSEDLFNKDHDHKDKQPLWYSTFNDALLTGNGVIMVRKGFSWQKTVDSIFIDYNHFEEAARDIHGSKFNLNKSKINVVQRKSDGQSLHKPFIDVWWLFDDGGLTILVAYLLTKSKEFRNCKIRVMVLLDLVGLNQQTFMVRLMSKLRIDAEIVEVNLPSGVKVERDTQRASTVGGTGTRGDSLFGDDKERMNVDDVVVKFEPVASNENDNGDNDNNDDNGNTKGGDDDDNKGDDDETQMDIHGSVKIVSGFAQKKIRNYKLIGETITARCIKDATSLCVITVPFPRKKFNWWEYAAVVDNLAPDAVPTLLVRGNQQQVLTSTM